MIGQRLHAFEPCTCRVEHTGTLEPFLRRLERFDTVRCPATLPTRTSALIQTFDPNIATP